MSDKRQSYIGDYCSFTRSFDGHCYLSVNLHREKRTRSTEYLPLDIRIDRSDVACIVYALRKFLAKEQEELDAAKF